MCASTTHEVRLSISRPEAGLAEWYATCSEDGGRWEYLDDGSAAVGQALAHQLQDALAAWLVKEFGHEVQLTIYAG